MSEAIYWGRGSPIDLGDGGARLVRHRAGGTPAVPAGYLHESLMTTLDIAQARVFQQGIAGTQFEEPSEVVARLGAVQAQDYPAALWAVGLRTRDATRA